jgi:GTPase involved in cell partitioning and DNA repair
LEDDFWHHIKRMRVLLHLIDTTSDDFVISDTQKLHAEAESCLLRDRLNISITPLENGVLISL